MYARAIRSGLILFLAASVMVALASPATAEDKPPVVSPMNATFAKPVTTYQVNASDPNGRTLNYTWFKSGERQCGTFDGKGPTATWTHPDASDGGNCPNETTHPGTITVVVDNGLFRCTVNYPNGSVAGIGPAPGPCNPATTERSPSPTAGAITGPTSTGLPWIWIVGGGIIIIIICGGGIFVFIRRRTVSRPPPCGCGCGVLINGPTELGVCACADVTYSLSQTGSETAVLRATLADGRPLFSRAYHAKLTPTCQGGGIPGDAAYSWSLSVGKDVLTLGVTATMPYSCPGDAPASCMCVCENFQVALHAAPCLVSIITIDVLVGVGHAAMHITCGEFSTIYSFTAKNPGNYVGDFTGQPAVVQTFSSSGIQDGIGEDYSGYYPDYNKQIWILELSCEKCDCLRRYWESLQANPGTYALGWWNCASRVYDALIHCGIEVKGPADGSWFRPGVIDNHLDHCPREQTDKDGHSFTVSEKVVIPAVSK